MHLIEREINDSIWLLIPFLTLLIFYAIQYQRAPKFYYSTIKGVLDFQHFRFTYKNEENKNKIDLLIIASLSFIGLYINSTGFLSIYSGYHILIQSLIFMLILLLYYFFKALVIKLTGYLFDANQLINVYLIYYKYYLNAIAILAIPFLAINIISFSQEGIINLNLINNIIFMCLVFILYLLRLFHIVSKGIENKISYLNIFLYLCTLEISPIVFIYYILSEY